MISSSNCKKWGETETYNKNLNSRGVEIKSEIGNDIDFSVNLINANENFARKKEKKVQWKCKTIIEKIKSFSHYCYY